MRNATRLGGVFLLNLIIFPQFAKSTWQNTHILSIFAHAFVEKAVLLQPIYYRCVRVHAYIISNRGKHINPSN